MELKLGAFASTLQSWILLIVPYGIETKFGQEAVLNFVPFNRTLWN